MIGIGCVPVRRDWIRAYVCLLTSGVHKQGGDVHQTLYYKKRTCTVRNYQAYCVINMKL